SGIALEENRAGEVGAVGVVGDAVVADGDDVAGALDDAGELGRAVGFDIDVLGGADLVHNLIPDAASDVVLGAVLGLQDPAGVVVVFKGGIVTAFLPPGRKVAGDI